MDAIYGCFLRVLRAAIRGGKYVLSSDERKYLPQICRLAADHRILPLTADCLYDETLRGIARHARDITAAQAQRTADFLLLIRKLAEEYGLHPVVVKGIVCRSLYPEPEQRPSEDEDLLILPEEYPAYRSALEAYGLRRASGEDSYEVLFTGEEHFLSLELHSSLFPPESEAYGDCSRFFEGVAARAEDIVIRGVTLKTLAPTDHMLFLLCHAYKHFLHAGIGIRQLCDMALMAERDGAQIDWAQIRGSCEELRIAVLAAALFRIAERHLGFAAPEAFADIEVDESDLLDDMLSGGLYGVVDIDRAHSSTMTLEAVVAARSGRRRRGALHSLFLPLSEMQGHFPYLKKYPWLLPWAWLQRIWRYLTRRKNPAPVSPQRSIRIARERIALLREYHIVES